MQHAAAALHAAEEERLEEATDPLRPRKETLERLRPQIHEIDDQNGIETAGESGGGLVKVVLSGNQEPRRVEIVPEALNEGVEVLSDLVEAAMKDAYAKSTATMRERMEELTEGLNLPGL